MIEVRLRSLKDVPFSSYLLRFAFGGCCIAFAGRSTPAAKN